MVMGKSNSMPRVEPIKAKAFSVVSSGANTKIPIKTGISQQAKHMMSRVMKSCSVRAAGITTILPITPTNSGIRPTNKKGNEFNFSSSVSMPNPPPTNCWMTNTPKNMETHMAVVMNLLGEFMTELAVISEIDRDVNREIGQLSRGDSSPRDPRYIDNSARLLVIQR